MAEHTHILNRPVVFTEIPGSPKLPLGTRLSIKTAMVGNEHDVVALSPTGVRYEFKSTHIQNLLQTPWVDKLVVDEPVVSVVASPAPPPVVVVVTPPPPVEVNPYMIGDVASVETGVADDTLPQVDVTGTSAHENFVAEVAEVVATPVVVEEVAPEEEAEEENPTSSYKSKKGRKSK